MSLRNLGNNRESGIFWQMIVKKLPPKDEEKVHAESMIADHMKAMTLLAIKHRNEAEISRLRKQLRDLE